MSPAPGRTSADPEGGDAGGTLTLADARIGTAMEALSYASIEAFDEALELLASPVPDRFGELEGALAILFGELKASREALLAAQAEQRRLIERQAVDIRELSAPVLDLWDGVLALPIIGTIDPLRAEQLTARLLAAISAKQAQWVIIDITGASAVDTATAHHFVRMVRAGRLLGTQFVISGITPELSQTLVAGDVDFGDVATVRSLREALRRCLGAPAR